jgi:serine/threonine protein kinase
MLSGTRAFRRDTPVESMNAILTEEPADLSETNPNLSPALDRIVRRCLEKRPEQRFQTTSDLALIAVESAEPDTFIPGKPKVLFEGDFFERYDVSLDGKELLLSVRDVPGFARFHWLQNWTTLLKDQPKP